MALAAPGARRRSSRSTTRGSTRSSCPTFFLWARARGVGETLFALFYKERPDERLALAFYDQTYVTEQLVDDVERALDRPGTAAAALAAVRGHALRSTSRRSYRTIASPTLLLWGARTR